MSSPAPMQLVSLLAVLAAAAGPSLPAAAEDVRAMDDRDYVSLTGTVVSSSEGQFTLDYGEGLITVEMDDWGPADDALFIDPGDRVTVDGRIDDGFY